MSGAMIEYNAFYPGYDLDEINMVFDVDDPDFTSDLTMSNMNHCGLNIRQSKSDPLLQLKAHFCCSDFDNHNVQELALLNNWENLRENQVAFSWDSDCISDTDSMNQVSQENNMLTIEGLRNHYNSCFSCGVNWYEDHVSLDCPECGGYAMQRPCPECDGQCESTWRRDLAASHNTKQAKWEGECRKSRPQMNQKLYHNDNCEVLTNAMKSLKTSI